MQLFAEAIFEREIVATQALTNQFLNVRTVERVIKNGAVEAQPERELAIKSSNLETVEPITVVVVDALKRSKRWILGRVAPCFDYRNDNPRRSCC